MSPEMLLKKELDMHGVAMQIHKKPKRVCYPNLKLLTSMLLHNLLPTTIGFATHFR